MSTAQLMIERNFQPCLSTTMALQLPQQPNDPRVLLPQAPGNPPSLSDIHRATKLKLGVLESAASNHLNASTQDDVGRAVLYEHSVTGTYMAAAVGPAVAPPWFAAVQQQLNRIEHRLQIMEVSQAISRNAGNGDGSIYPFVTVNFNDGTTPTAPPHNLPALTSIAVINTLTAAICNQYLTGYGVQGAGNVAERRRLVKVAIGCRSL